MVYVLLMSWTQPYFKTFSWPVKKLRKDELVDVSSTKQLHRLSSSNLFIHPRINQSHLYCQIDCGSMVSTIPIHYLSEEQRRSIKPSTVVLSAYGGSRVDHVGQVVLSLEFQGGARIDNLNFLVTKMNTVPLIGNNILLDDNGQLSIDTKANKAIIRGTKVDLFYSETGKTSFVTSITAKTCSEPQRMMVKDSITIPANSEMMIMVETNFPPSSPFMMTNPQE